MPKTVDRPIPQTKKVWNLTVEHEPLDFPRAQAEVRGYLAQAGVDKKFIEPYSQILLGPGFLGAASPMGLPVESANRACNLGEPAELLRHGVNFEGVFKWLAHALSAPEPFCHFLALFVLADHDYHKDLAFGRIPFFREAECLDPLIDAITPLMGDKTYDNVMATVDQWSMEGLFVSDISAVLRRLITRGLLHPAAAIDRAHYLGRQNDLPNRAYDQRWLNEGWNAPGRFEFWFRNLGAGVYDAFHEFWLGFDDEQLACFLWEAIHADRRVMSDRKQREAVQRLNHQVNEHCARLGQWFREAQNRPMIEECLGLIDAGAACARVERELGQRFGTSIQEIVKRHEAAKSALVTAVPRSAHTRESHPLTEEVRRFWTTEPKAESAETHFHLFAGENLFVHLDERIQRGCVSRELKGAYVHLGYRLLSQTGKLHHHARQYQDPWSDKLGLDEVDKIVLQRTEPNVRGPVEKRLGEAALHALADLRATAARVVRLGPNDPIPDMFRAYLEDAARTGNPDLAAQEVRKKVDQGVEWEARQDFVEQWPEFERQLVIAHECGSLWASIKQALLALRNLKGVPCVEPDLRYEVKADELPSAGWKVIANWLGARLRTALDAEQKDDPELQGLRGSWAEFLLERLLPSKANASNDKHKTPYEESPVYRVRHLRALKHLRCNPEGKGHKIVHLVIQQDPSPEVRQEAKAVYEIIRRTDGHLEPEAARRSLFAAFYLFREAQVRASGGEVAARARRTWYNEARDAKRDYKWFIERNKK